MEESLYTYKCELIRVIDGDTIEAKIDLGFDTWSFKTIRLSGIDTPEIRTKNLEEKKLGNQSKQAVIDIFNKTKQNGGKVFFYLKSVEYDSFGRSLGVVYTIDDVNLNEYLLANGYAKIYQK